MELLRVTEFLKPPFAMLLGHTTYNIFAGYWPKQDPKRLFADGTCSATWKLVKSGVGDAGVIVATYEPAGGLVTGTIGA